MSSNIETSLARGEFGSICIYLNGRMLPLRIAPRMRRAI